MLWETASFYIFVNLLDWKCDKIVLLNRFFFEPWSVIDVWQSCFLWRSTKFQRCAKAAIERSQMGSKTFMLTLWSSKRRNNCWLTALIKGWPVMNLWFMVLRANARTCTMMHTNRAQPQENIIKYNVMSSEGRWHLHSVCSFSVWFGESLRLVHSVSIEVRWESWALKGKSLMHKIHTVAWHTHIFTSQSATVDDCAPVQIPVSHNTEL